MAELVEQQLQQTLPETELMENLGLLSSDEIRELITNRRSHLYKTINSRNSVKDCLTTLNYEATLLEHLKECRETLQIKENYEQIEGIIIKRLQIYLRTLTRKRYNEMALWRMRIDFSQNQGQLSETRLAYREMASRHSRLLWVWLEWAHFEMIYKKDFHKARELLLSEAPSYHPHNFILKRELFRFELIFLEFTFKNPLNAEKATDEKQSSESFRKVLGCGTARLVYRLTAKQFPEVAARVQIYHLAHKFPFAVHLREEIYQDIISACGLCPEVSILEAERRALGIQSIEKEEPSEEGTDHSDCGEEQADSEQNQASDAEEDDCEVKSESDASDLEDEKAGGKEEQDINEEENNDSEHNSGSSDSDSDDDSEQKANEVPDYMKPYKIYQQTLETRDKREKKLPITSIDRNNMLRIYLSSLEKTLSSAGDDSAALLTAWWKSAVALLYHCWSCNKSRQLIASTIGHTAVTHKAHLTPVQLLQWGVLSDELQLFDASTKCKLLKEASSQHTEVAAVKIAYIAALTRDDNVRPQQVIKEYNALCSGLSSPWLRVVHDIVTASLKPGADRNAFLKQQCQQHYCGELAINTRLAMLWQQYNDNEIYAARSVYTNYWEMPPFSDKFHASMCLMELYTAALYSSKDSKLYTPAISTKIALVIDRKGAKQSSVEISEDDSSDSASSDEEEIIIEEECIENDEVSDEASNTINKHSLSDNPDVSKVRSVFQNAFDQNEGKHHDFWLAWVHFEKKFGDVIAEGKARQRGNDTMTSRSLHAFWELEIDIKNNKYLEEAEITEYKSPSNIKNKKSLQEPGKPGLLVSLPKDYFDEPKPSDVKRRDACFIALRASEQSVSDKPDSGTTACSSGATSWLDVLTTLLDGKHLRPRLVEKNAAAVMSAAEKLEQIRSAEQSDLLKPNMTSVFACRVFRERFIGSDELDFRSVEATYTAPLQFAALSATKVDPRNNVDAMLARSSVLDPDNARRSTNADKINKKLQKKLLLKKHGRSAGKGWDFMRRPEMSEAVKRDLEVLQMRGVLNPKQRFKSTVMKKLPNNFTMGTVMDNAKDFYSDRLTKKQRKATIAEQIMDDEDILKYQKRKFTQIVGNQSKKKKRNNEDYIKV